MNKLLSSSFLAEWEYQEAVMLAWPHENTDWRPWLSEINRSYVELAQAISETATPLILCQDKAHQKAILELVGPELANKICFFECPYNDTWCRDYGPISLGSEHPNHLVSFKFTGWGNKYEADSDNQVNQALENANTWAVPFQEVNFDLEGGAIETDGQGTLLTTEACLLAGNRNKGMNKATVTEALIKHLGVNRVLWLQHGALIGDDTDSHIDNLVRFSSPDTLVYALCDNQEDHHYHPLKAMEQEVLNLKQVNGQPYTCIPLPIPEAIFDENDQRLPASYVNFLILNNTLIVPTFNSSKDATALSNLKRAFPDYRIIPINGKSLIKQYGGPHCATMQIPQGCWNKGGFTCSK